MKTQMLQAMIAVVVLVAVFQMAGAKPYCFCHDLGRFCVQQCAVKGWSLNECGNECNRNKMDCYRKCRAKRDINFEMLADEEKTTR